MKPQPDYTRLLTTLRGNQADRVPLLELIVDPEIKAAYLARPLLTVADDIDFWYQAGYDCATVYPSAPSMWFYDNERRADTVLSDAYTATGYRRWASEGKGLIQDWNDLDRFPLPTLDQIDFSYFDQAGRYLPAGMGLIGAWGDIFTFTWEAMGFAEFSYALSERPEFVYYLFAELGKLAVKINEVMLSYDAVKALWFSDDLAYRTGFLVSPAIYRQHLFPWLKQIGDLCRKAHRPFLFHSDGLLWDIIDDLIGCGICALHPIEPIAMNIREVKRRYGDRLCLVGNVDVDTLSRGTPEQVRAEVSTLLREVAPGGGYCLGSSNTIPNYARLENYQAMLEEAGRLGSYPIRLLMDKTRMITKRQQSILHHLAIHQQLEVGQLSQLLHVSPSTIRRELKAIEKNGLLVRTHGTAQLPAPIRYDPTYEQRAAQQLQAKRAIASAASRLVTPGMVVGIMGGTTCTELARWLRAVEEVTIVTNALNVALELQGQLNRRVMIVGGLLNQNSYELVGSLVVQALQTVHLSIAFIGASGISPEYGISISDEPETAAARAFMAAADRSVIIADSTKIGQATFARLCPLQQVDLLITDNQIPPEQRLALEKAGLKLLLAGSQHKDNLWED